MGLKDWISEHIVEIGAKGQGQPEATPEAGKPAGGAPAPKPAPGEPAAVRPSPRTVAQVAKEVPRPRIDEQLLTEPAERPAISFDQVYRAAGVQAPPHGYDVFKVEQLLANPRLESLTPEARSAAVLVALDAQGVKIEDVVKDAVTRDKALDAFEQFQLKKLVEMQGRVEAENKRLHEEIEQFIKSRHAAVEANQQKMKAFQKEIDTWRKQKALEERRIAGVVAYFTTSNPITLSRTVSALPELEPSGPVDPDLDELRGVPDLEHMGKDGSRPAPAAAAKPPPEPAKPPASAPAKPAPAASPAPAPPLGAPPVVDLASLLDDDEPKPA